MTLDGWRNDQNKSFRSQKVIKLYSWQLIPLNSGNVPNTQLDEYKIDRTNIINRHNCLICWVVISRTHDLWWSTCAVAYWCLVVLKKCSIFFAQTWFSEKTWLLSLWFWRFKKPTMTRGWSWLIACY